MLLGSLKLQITVLTSCFCFLSGFVTQKRKTSVHKSGESLVKEVQQLLEVDAKSDTEIL